MLRGGRRSGSLLFAAGGDQFDLLASQLDLKFIARLQAQQSGVGLAHQQVAVALNGGHVGKFAAGLANALAAAVTKADALGFQEGFVESGEVQALGAVLFGADVAAAPNQIRLGGIAQLFDFGEEIRTGEHRCAASSLTLQPNPTSSS